MADKKLIEKLRKRANEIGEEMARSTIGFKDKARLEGELKAINNMLAEMALENNDG